MKKYGVLQKKKKIFMFKNKDHLNTHIRQKSYFVLYSREIYIGYFYHDYATNAIIYNLKNLEQTQYKIYG